MVHTARSPTIGPGDPAVAAVAAVVAVVAVRSAAPAVRAPERVLPAVARVVAAVDSPVAFPTVAAALVRPRVVSQRAHLPADLAPLLPIRPALHRTKVTRAVVFARFAA